MTTLTTYHARYAEILAEMQREGVAAPCRAAWERVEMEFVAENGTRRYLSYENFRSAASHRRKRQNVNKMTTARALLTP